MDIEIEDSPFFGEGEIEQMEGKAEEDEVSCIFNWENRAILDYFPIGK